jgi:hypothetical protein
MITRFFLYQGRIAFAYAFAALACALALMRIVELAIGARRW